MHERGFLERAVVASWNAVVPNTQHPAPSTYCSSTCISYRLRYFPLALPSSSPCVPLATRQGVPALAHDRVVGVLELADEVVGVGGPRGRDDLLQRRLRQAVAHVVEQRPVKQVRILEHHPDLPAVMSGLEPPDVHAVDPDRAAADVVESSDPIHG